jgi:hypothetical protein
VARRSGTRHEDLRPERDAEGGDIRSLMHGVSDERQRSKGQASDELDDEQCRVEDERHHEHTACAPALRAGRFVLVAHAMTVSGVP